MEEYCIVWFRIDFVDGLGLFELVFSSKGLVKTLRKKGRNYVTRWWC